jgi:hypothetical protein
MLQVGAAEIELRFAVGVVVGVSGIAIGRVVGVGCNTTGRSSRS